MKKLLSLFVILCSFTFCSKTKIEGEVNKDFLIKNEWYWYDGSLEKDWLVRIKFDKKDVFSSFGETDEELTMISGRFSVANNKLTLVYQRYSGHVVILPEDESKMGPKYNIVLTFKNDINRKYFVDDENKIFIVSDMIK